MKVVTERDLDRQLQVERDRDPKRGKFKFHHRMHGSVLANTKSEARAKCKARGPLGKFPVRLVK